MNNKKQQQKQAQTTKVNEVIDAYKNLDESIQSDVNGSYTGIPLDGSLRPVQDADDL